MPTYYLFSFRSGNVENDHFQQYVQVDSNMYLGTKDGIKYSLTQTPDSKLRLVDALNEADASSDISKVYGFCFI